jgi:hypothetical protein
MKILLFAFSIVSFTTIGQITISSIDLPQAGQNYYRSNANNPTINLAETGANYTWDYSDLQRVSRDTLRYETVEQTPIFYQFQFNSPINLPYKATEAKFTPDVSLGGFLDMTNNYLFSKNSSTEWTEVGIGTTITSVPVPTKYSDIKVKLKLPLNFNDSNSDDFSYLINLPTFGAMGQDGSLSYTVDGWGILKTPAGSFEVLRVKTEVTKSDTIFIQLMGFGLRIPSNETIYEWYSKGEGFPILTVTEQLGQITSTIFNDDMTVSIEDGTNKENNNIYPNPVQNILNLELNNFNYSVTIIDLSGRIVLQPNMLSPTQIDVSLLPKGVYFIKLVNQDTNEILQFIKK